MRKTIKASNRLPAAFVLAILGLSASVIESQAAPAASTNTAGTITTKPKPALNCTSVQGCNEAIAHCISLGPGWDFEPTSVDQLGRPASGHCRSPSSQTR